MFLREAPTATLADIADEWTTTHATWGGGLHNVEFHLEDSTPIIKIGEHEVAATKKGIAAFGGFLDVPTKFLERVMADEQQFILDKRLERSGEQDITVSYTTDGGIIEVMKSGQRRILPEQIVQSAMHVMPEESMVTDAWATLEDLRLDVIAPEGYDRGWGGDRGAGEYTWRGEKKVGDITGGGIRIWQNRKQNLAPGVQPYLYRLACTNGYEVQDLGMRVDARGLDVEEVLMSLEMEARRAFARVENDIASFYDLRTQPVEEDRTGMLRRITREAGLPARTVGVLEDLLPGHLNDTENPTMFDLVNLVTNYANAGQRAGAARTLQRVGGGMIADHAARCSTCHHRLD